MVNLGLPLLLVMPVSIMSTRPSSPQLTVLLPNATAWLLAVGNRVQVTHRTDRSCLMQFCNLSGGHRAILKFPYIPGKVLHIVNNKATKLTARAIK